MMAFYDVVTLNIQKGRGQLHCNSMMLNKKMFWNQPLNQEVRKSSIKFSLFAENNPK